MDNSQVSTVALASVPTMLTVLIGILINNSRLTDVQSRISSLETNVNARINSVDSRITSLEGKIGNLDHKFETRFDLVLGKIVEVHNRLTRIEAQGR